MIDIEGYRVAHPEELETPALLVFEGKLEHNLRTMRELAGGMENLMAHVKTHKSAEIARRQVKAGITCFKAATLTEVEMVAQEADAQVLLAYPLLTRKKIQRLVDLQAKYARSRLQLLTAHAENVTDLSTVATDNQVSLEVMIDLDVGQHRTGIDLEAAVALYGQIATSPGLVPAGLHAYDGHLGDPDPAIREADAQECLGRVRALAAELEGRGWPVPDIVMGGSRTFPTYARAEGVWASPGTWIYWDLNYLVAMPEMPFQPAALVLTQVIDHQPERGEVTLDLGSKAISTDPGMPDRLRLLGAPQAQLLLQNEEHAVVDTAGHALGLGDYLLALPGHVCTTVFRYPGSWFIGATGEVAGWNEHTARDRGPLSP